jgi:hypothetical protein
VLSNFQDLASGVDHPDAKEQFFLHVAPVPGGEKQMAYFLGIVDAIPDTRREEFGRLVRDCKPLVALKNKAAQVISEAGPRPAARNSVGPNMMTAELFPDPARPPHSEYESATGGQTIPLIPMVHKRAGLAIAGIRVNVMDRFPGNTGRNAPCTCGSGQKFKHCHGRN